MKRVCLLLLLLCLPVSGVAGDMEITPFRTSNQSPLVRIFGLPADNSATLAASGRLRLGLSMDVASEYAASATAGERIILDGESYRWTLAAYYGAGNRLEVGIEVPYQLYGGGFLDGFIEGWHDTFGLPQGGRDSAPRGRLLYRYYKDGVRKLDVSHSGSGGIGDMSLHAGWKLYDAVDAGSHDSLALRAALKLPSGDSGALRGSGSVDLSLALCGGMNHFTEWGSLGLYGALGGMAMTDGAVLRDQRNNLAGFGLAGLGWGPAQWISFKAQIDAHTPLYRGSSLDELSRYALMLTVGGALRFPGDYLLDIGVSEDLAVTTAPDVGFHFGLSKVF